MQAMSPSVSSPASVAVKAVATTTVKGDGSDFSAELDAAVGSPGKIVSSDAKTDENAKTSADEIEVAIDEDPIEGLEFLSEKDVTETDDHQSVAHKNPDILQQLILKAGRKLMLETGPGAGPKSGPAVTEQGLDAPKSDDITGESKSNTKLQSMETTKQLVNQAPLTETGGVKVAETVEAVPKDKTEKTEKTGDIEPKQKVEALAPAKSEIGAKSSEPLPAVLQSNLANQTSQLSPPAKSILTAIHENTNWTKPTSTPVVQTMTQVQNSGAVLQSLQVQMHPVELGSVNLKLRMVQGQMRIDVTVENDAAYQALIADQDGLMNTVRSMGYKVDSLSISNPNGQTSLMEQENSQKGDAAAGNSKGSNDAYGESDEGTEDTSNSSANIDDQSHIYI